MLRFLRRLKEKRVTTHVRILIIADSLGCPRSEINIHNVWTDRILNAFSGKNIVFYTILSRGLTTNHLNYNFIELLMPDMIVCQIGIVDCVRRALSQKALSRVKRIPFLNNLIRKFVRKNHYFLTKFFETRYTDPKQFESNIKKLSSLAPKTGFIRIAAAGESMKKQTFNCQHDIDYFNRIIRAQSELIDPYKDEPTNNYILSSDGHHLNHYGHDLVFQCVYDYIENFLTIRQVRI